MTPIDLSSPVSKSFHTADSYYSSLAKSNQSNHASASNSMNLSHSSEDKGYMDMNSSNYSIGTHRNGGQGNKDISPNTEITKSNTKMNSNTISNYKISPRIMMNNNHSNSFSSPLVDVHDTLPNNCPDGNNVRNSVRNLSYDDDSKE